MPRTSRAALSVVSRNDNPQRPTLEPMQALNKAERKVFDHTMRTNTHLGRADIPMLEIYSIAYCRAAAAKRKNCQTWDSEVRTVIALSTKLKITPASQPRRKPQPISSYYDQQRWENDDA